MRRNPLLPWMLIAWMTAGGGCQRVQPAEVPPPREVRSVSRAEGCVGAAVVVSLTSAARLAQDEAFKLPEPESDYPRVGPGEQVQASAPVAPSVGSLAARVESSAPVPMRVESIPGAPAPGAVVVVPPESPGFWASAWAFVVSAFWWGLKAIGVGLALLVAGVAYAVWRDSRPAKSVPLPTPVRRYSRAAASVTVPSSAIPAPSGPQARSKPIPVVQPAPVSVSAPPPVAPPLPAPASSSPGAVPLFSSASLTPTFSFAMTGKTGGGTPIAPCPAACPPSAAPAPASSSQPLFVSKGPVAPRRGELLGDGGEGAVYADAEDPTRCLKVFKAMPSAEALAKYRHMVTHRGLAPLRRDARLAWPSALYHAPDGEWTVVMPRAEGVSAEHLHPASLSRSFPRWRGRPVRLRARVACAVAEVVADLHEAGVLMADLHPGNILVHPETGDIRLIDCDSFQIQGPPFFRSDCHRPEYASPEFLTTKAARDTHSEDFSLAILLFQLLHGFQHPCVAHGVATPDEAIRRGVFAYADDPARVPAGDWLARWRRRPAPIRAAFTATFGPGHAQVTRRTRAREWARLLREHELQAAKSV